MTPKSRSIHEARFPEIRSLIRGARTEDLIIHVEPLDKDALYREVVWNSETAVYDANRPNQAGIVSERVYRTVKTANGYQLESPYERLPRHLSGGFLRHLAKIDNPCERIVVWQQIAWYEAQEGQRPIVSGRRLGTETRVDVYLPPKTGIQRLLLETDVSKNVRLTSPIIDSIRVEVSMETHKSGKFADWQEMEKAVDRLRTIAAEFQFGAYFHGLREVAMATNCHKLAGEVGGFRVGVEFEGKRLRVVVENGDVTVAFSGDPNRDDPCFTIANSDFTLDEAHTLTKEFVRAWKAPYRPIPQPAMFGILRPTDNAPAA